MKVIHFPRWLEVLAKSSVSEVDRRSFEVTLRWYLSWCYKRGVGCTVESARTFVDWAVEEKRASKWMADRWRDAIRWFFLSAKAQVEQSLECESERCEVAKVGFERFEGAKVDFETSEARCRDAEERILAGTEDEQKILAEMRRKGMALRTERAYMGTFRNFMRWSGLMDATEITGDRVKGYLNHLAMDRAVASSTQKGALNALVFVAQKVFGLDLGDIGEFVKAKNRRRIPVVMSQAETRLFLAKLEGEKLLMAQLQYAAGLRVSEGVIKSGGKS